MKKLFFTLTIALIGMVVNAQTDSTKNWSLGGDVGLNTSQVGFTNWAQGGQNTISGMTFLHLYANYKKNKLAWDNYANLEYGLMQQGSDVLKKSDDLLEVGTKLGLKASEHWYYTAQASFKSQFAKGYDYDNYVDENVYISNFMAPAYIFAGLGMDYKPNDNLSLYISPATMKLIVVDDDTLSKYGAFGVQKEEIDENGNLIAAEKTRLELGAYLKFMFKHEIAKNVNFLTTLDLYSNYLEDPQNVDVDWKVEIIMKVNSFLNASVKTHLIYDDNIDIIGDNDANGNPTYGPKTQFKEAIAVGLIYKFNN
jgi:hypothetical protein